MPDLPLHVVGSGHPGSAARAARVGAQRVVFRGDLSSEPTWPAATAGRLSPSLRPYGEGIRHGATGSHGIRGVPVVAWRRRRPAGNRSSTAKRVPGRRRRDTCASVCAAAARPRTSDEPSAKRRGTVPKAFTWQRTAAGIEAVCQQLARMPAPGPGRVTRRQTPNRIRRRAAGRQREVHRRTVASPTVRSRPLGDRPTSSGSTTSPASPTISGSEPRLLATSGRATRQCFERRHAEAFV